MRTRCPGYAPAAERAPNRKRGSRMNRHETRCGDRAHDCSIQNQSATHAEGFPFPTAKAAALRVMAAEPLRAPSSRKAASSPGRRRAATPAGPTATSTSRCASPTCPPSGDGSRARASTTARSTPSTSRATRRGRTSGSTPSSRACLSASAPSSSTMAL